MRTKSILMSFQILREKNLDKIKSIYANYFRKDNMMQEIDELTARY